MANQLDNQPYTELSVQDLAELERQIYNLEVAKDIHKSIDSDGQLKLQELIAERDFRRNHGTPSEKMYFIDKEMHDISMKLYGGRFRFSNPSDKKQFYELKNRLDELGAEKSAIRSEPQKKDVSSVGTSNLNELQEELANATEALDDMRDFMPSQPTSEYLNQMQETALRIEKLQKEINSIKGDLPLQAKTNTSISKFSISPLPQPINGSVAVCSATFYNMLTVNGITITNGRNGLYVKMPQKRTKQGGYIDVAHPLSADGRRNINQTLLSAYREGNFKQSFEVQQPKVIAAQNSVKYPPEYGNSLARMDLVVDDMVVHNVKIIKGNDEKLHFSMPGYKAKDGNYTSICNPASKDAFAKFSQASMEEYNTNYSFRKLTDDDVAALKESGIKVQCRKNAQGENVVKFKFEDLQKVNAIINPTPTAAPKI